MTAPFTLPPVDEPLQTELRLRYRETHNAEMRTRYQMLLLALDGRTSTQIARLVCRSQDTVVRVLKRFLQGGLEAVPRRTAPGRPRTITPAWEEKLLRVIELDLHEVGVVSANWTTQLLAEFKEYLYLVYTPAYDPDANRIEWLWRISRRVVTHNHQRPTFELLLAPTGCVTRLSHQVGEAVAAKSTRKALPEKPGVLVDSIWYLKV